MDRCEYPVSELARPLWISQIFPVGGASWTLDHCEAMLNNVISLKGSRRGDNILSFFRDVTRREGGGGLEGAGNTPPPFNFYVLLWLKVILPFARNPEAAMESFYQTHRYVVIIVTKYAIHFNIAGDKKIIATVGSGT